MKRLLTMLMLTVTLVTTAACGKTPVDDAAAPTATETPEVKQPSNSTKEVVTPATEVMEEEPTPEPKPTPRVEQGTYHSDIFGDVQLETPDYTLSGTDPEFGDPIFSDRYYEEHVIADGFTIQGYVTEDSIYLLEQCKEAVSLMGGGEVCVTATHRDEKMENPWPGFQQDEYSDVDLVYTLSMGTYTEYVIMRSGIPVGVQW